MAVFTACEGQRDIKDKQLYYTYGLGKTWIVSVKLFYVQKITMYVGKLEKEKKVKSCFIV